VIFTAVSPNGDGQNDVFYIAGIEDFPETVALRYGLFFNTKTLRLNLSLTNFKEYLGLLLTLNLVNC